MRIFLLSVLMLFCAATFAQQMSLTKPPTFRAVTPATNQARPVVRKGDRYVGIPYNNNPARKLVAAPTYPTVKEQEIGYTYYDQQTNGSISNRITYNVDGTISAVWTFASDFTSGFPARGTGYNYFDGTSWQAEPSTTIEGSIRTGYPNIGTTSVSPLTEVVIAHGIQLPVSPSTLETNRGMVLSTRAKGTGAWTVDENKLGAEPADTIDIWSKMAIGGANGKTIHAIWLGFSPNADAYSVPKVDGQKSPLLYSRSTDGGATWERLDTIIPQMDSTQYVGFSGDDYAIDAKGDTIAIAVAGMGSDVFMLKSTDNGNTWTKTTVYPFTIPNFNRFTMTTDTVFPHTGAPDTLLSPAGDPAVLVDRNGEVHVFFSVVRIVAKGNDSLFFFPYTDGLYYWNESMGSTVPQLVAFQPDLNGDNVVSIANPGSLCPNDAWGFGDYGGGITEKPSAGVDANNNIYLSYQSVDELSDTIQYHKNYKHVYVIKSTDGGTTWTDPNAALDIVQEALWQNGTDISSEGVYAAMAKRFNTNVPIIYQRDDVPGSYLGSTANQCDYTNNSTVLSGGIPNKIIYTSIDSSLHSFVGLSEVKNAANGTMLSPAYPNPAIDFTQFNVTLTKTANVQVNVTDLLGQNMYSENKGRLAPGVHTVTLNTSYLSAGVYFYSVTVGSDKLTGKMVVN